MEHLSKFIHAKHPEKLHRQNILVPLSQHLNIEHKKYRNRSLLCDAMMKQMTYNTTDPVTLEPISHIPIDDRVAWWQNNRRYVARKTSIKMLLDAGHEINPWVTDLASGIQNAENPELYDALYNMTRVKSLMADVHDIQTCQDEVDDVPEHTKAFFKFENLCEDLYTVKLTTVLQTSDSRFGLKIFLSGIDYACAQYYEYGDEVLIELLEYMKYYARAHIQEWISHSNILPGVFAFFDYVSSVEPERSNDITRTIIMCMNDIIR